MELLIQILSIYCIATLLCSRALETKVRQGCVCNLSEKKDEQVADCTHKQLSVVPECLPDSLTKLYMTGNTIKLHPLMFKRFLDLKVLYLDRNNIEAVPEGTFEGLGSLKELSLALNRIYGNALDKSALTPLKYLDTLYINGNCDGLVHNCSYPDEALSKAPSLRMLHLDGLPNTSFGEGFESLKHLESIVMSDDDGHCKLDQVTPQTFQSLQSTPLATLKLYDCDIKVITPNSFAGLKNLTTLNINYSRHLCNDALRNTTLGLNTTNIKSLILSHWCRSLLTPLILVNDLIEGVIDTELENLELSSDRIILIDPNFFLHLPLSIKILSLKDNYLNEASFLKQVNHLKNLEVIDVSLQNYYRVSTPTDEIEELITEPRPGSEDQIDLQISVGDPCHPEIDNFNDDARNSTLSALLSVFEMDSKNGTRINEEFIKLPRNITKVIMNDIKLCYPVPPVSFSTNKLEVLNASDCLLLAILGPWRGLDELKHLDLSFNLLGLIFPDSFLYMKNLRLLLLNDNHIGTHIMRDAKGDMFSTLELLEFLDMSRNEINDLPSKIFQNLKSLKRLSLSGNAILNVTFVCDGMVSLKYLDLSNNEIVTLSEQTTKKLDRIAAKTFLEVNLTGNNLMCDCDNEYFARWLLVTKVNLTSRDKLMCKYINGSNVRVEDLQLVMDELFVTCISWIVVASCVVAFTGILLVIFLVATVYHKRWQIRYLYYMGRRTVNPYHPLEDCEVQLDIDAYISYDENQDDLRQFVMTKLLPYLREENLTVTCREELQSGRMLHNVISGTLRRSSKVIVLISSHYCDHFWNKFEFNMAAYEGIYTKRKVLIPLSVGEVLKEDLHEEVVIYLSGEEIPVLPTTPAAPTVDLTPFYDYIHSKMYA